MAFVPTTGVICTYFRFTKDNQQIEFGLCWQHDGGEAPPRDDAAFVNVMGVTTEAEIAALMTTDAEFREIYGVPQDTAIAGTYTYTATPPVVGTVNDALPNNVALAIKFSTPNRGRSGRGRIYWPFWGEAQVTRNQVSQSSVNAILGFIQALEDEANNLGYSLVVVSRQNEGVPRQQGLAQLVTAKSVVDLTIDSQRRRLPGRGR